MEIGIGMGLGLGTGVRIVRVEGAEKETGA
jgi:hypothetical protein